MEKNSPLQEHRIVIHGKCEHEIIVFVSFEEDEESFFVVLLRNQRVEKTFEVFGWFFSFDENEKGHQVVPVEQYLHSVVIEVLLQVVRFEGSVVFQFVCENGEFSRFFA